MTESVTGNSSSQNTSKILTIILRRMNIFQPNWISLVHRQIFEDIISFSRLINIRHANFNKKLLFTPEQRISASRSSFPRTAGNLSII